MVSSEMHSKDTHTALPIYMQISESLMRDIASGRYVEGERLPPERSLAATYKTKQRHTKKTLDKILPCQEFQIDEKLS